MNVLLIDADSKIPNLALMKISAYHKQQGDNITLIRLFIPYYPDKKKKVFYAPKDYDIIYCSIIFDVNKNLVVGDDIIFGGTGYSLEIKLSKEIECLEPDYSLYPDNDISYGFLTRGCIRNCSFCKVPKKEGYIYKNNTIQNIVRHSKVKFMDNNILAYEGHKELLAELVDKKIKCCFNQGLDIRLIDEENSRLLSNLNYLGEYIFAFDSWSYKKIIEEKIELLKWRRDWQVKMFVYIHPDMPLSDIVNRVKWLKENKMLAYIMRDISCWESIYNYFYVDVCAYCNQPNIYKKMDFKLFLEKRHTDKKRISDSLKIWNEETQNIKVCDVEEKQTTLLDILEVR